KNMIDEIKKAGEMGDSVGGITECIVSGLPIGFGGIWFEALDSEIARAMFSIPACKGVEFGKGFALADMKGSESNDQYFYSDGIKTKTNNMGGIVGGMSDGAPMVFRCVFKPTPSISRLQSTVDLRTEESTTIRVEGRHDPCIVSRVAVVVESMAALVLADQIKRDF
ncbi:MAG TPA: chorismate synthase, partial [Candidatus Methanomethylophilaceae archaeon]|nr:chorismate synthase [Candidatus Methanomethylophilaceae archaeon]